MAAGPLRARVTFQKEVRTADGGGGYSNSWTDQCTVWGELKTKSARERLQADRLEGSLGAVLRVRSSSDTRLVQENWRAVIKGVPYQIRSTDNPDRRNKFILMDLERGVGT